MFVHGCVHWELPGGRSQLHAPCQRGLLTHLTYLSHAEGTTHLLSRWNQILKWDGDIFVSKM